MNLYVCTLERKPGVCDAASLCRFVAAHDVGSAFRFLAAEYPTYTVTEVRIECKIDHIVAEDA